MAEEPFSSHKAYFEAKHKKQTEQNLQKRFLIQFTLIQFFIFSFNITFKQNSLKKTKMLEEVMNELELNDSTCILIEILLNSNRKDQPPIFKGISIYVNGFTNPTSIELKELVCSHGGQHHNYYSKKGVTHIIATNLPSSKIQSLRFLFYFYPYSISFRKKLMNKLLIK